MANVLLRKTAVSPIVFLLINKFMCKVTS